MAESFVECDQSHVDVQLVIPELIKLIGTVCELIFTRITHWGIDMLAASLGSVHVMANKQVSINLERLKAICAAVTIPLVLYGSSGVNGSELAEGISSGAVPVQLWSPAFKTQFA